MGIEMGIIVFLACQATYWLGWHGGKARGRREGRSR